MRWNESFNPKMRHFKSIQIQESCFSAFDTLILSPLIDESRSFKMLLFDQSVISNSKLDLCENWIWLSQLNLLGRPVIHEESCDFWENPGKKSRERLSNCVCNWSNFSQTTSNLTYEKALIIWPLSSRSVIEKLDVQK